MYFYKIIISLVSILVSYWPNGSTLTNHPDYDDSPVVREKYALFHCFKLRTCTPGGDKVCGYDTTEQFLAEFEDLCTFHKVNCQKRGFFQLVDEPICKGQKKFLSQTREYDMFDRNLTSIK